MNPCGFTHSLSMGLFHRWDPKRIFMHLTAYIDESGTHEDSSIIVLAGVIGYAGQWTKMEKKWGRMLAEHKLTHFHAKNAEHSSGECKGWTIEQRRSLYKRADKLTSQYSLFQFIASMDAAEYLDIYKVTGKRPKGMACPDSMYGLCVRYALSVIPLIAESKFGVGDAVINLVMELGHRNAPDAVRIFNDIKKRDIPIVRDRLGTITFADKRDCYGVQAADCLAYAGYRNEIAGGVEIVEHALDQGIWDRAKNVASKQNKVAKPNFRLRFEKEQLIKRKIVLLNTVRPKGNGEALWAQEQAAKLVEQQP